MKTTLLAVVPALLSLGAVVSAGQGFGFIGFEETGGMTTTVTPTTSTVTSTVL